LLNFIFFLILLENVLFNFSLLICDWPF